MHRAVHAPSVVTVEKESHAGMHAVRLSEPIYHLSHFIELHGLQCTVQCIVEAWNDAIASTELFFKLKLGYF